MGGRPHRRRRAHPARTAARAAEQIDRDRPIVFQCRSGSRSGLATQVFREAGFEAYNLPAACRHGSNAGREIEPADGDRRRPPPGRELSEPRGGTTRRGSHRHREAPPPQPGRAARRRRGAAPAVCAGRPADRCIRRPRRRPPSHRPPAQPPPAQPQQTRASGLRPRRPGSAGRPASGRRRGRRPTTGRPGRGREIEGLRAWVAQLDRKIGLRTYVTWPRRCSPSPARSSRCSSPSTPATTRRAADDIARLEQEIADPAGHRSHRTAGTGATDTSRARGQARALEGQVDDLAASQDASDKRVGVIEDDIDDLRQPDRRPQQRWRRSAGPAVSVRKPLYGARSSGGCADRHDHRLEPGRSAPGRRDDHAGGLLRQGAQEGRNQGPRADHDEERSPAITGTCPDCGTKIFKIGKMS